MDIAWTGLKQKPCDCIIKTREELTRDIKRHWKRMQQRSEKLTIANISEMLVLLFYFTLNVSVLNCNFVNIPTTNFHHVMLDIRNVQFKKKESKIIVWLAVK